MNAKAKKPTVNIRRGVSSDSTNIAHVHVLSWRESYQNILLQKTLDQITVEERQKMWNKILSNNNKEEVCFVAEDKNKNIIGFIHGGKARETAYSENIEIYSLYLLKNFQNQGIGFMLFKRFREQFPNRKVYLWVLKDNPAISFYEKLGGVAFDTKESLLYGELIQDIAYLFN